ncbi:hypothetical protein LP421_12860 [Rhizobium sp. RCAM05350]|nr:hypothetical protein LP421_12860 [Rhizobium sp. RCAM05350]
MQSRRGAGDSDAAFDIQRWTHEVEPGRTGLVDRDIVEGNVADRPTEEVPVAAVDEGAVCSGIGDRNVFEVDAGYRVEEDTGIARAVDRQAVDIDVGGHSTLRHAAGCHQHQTVDAALQHHVGDCYVARTLQHDEIHVAALHRVVDRHLVEIDVVCRDEQQSFATGARDRHVVQRDVAGGVVDNRRPVAFVDGATGE